MKLKFPLLLFILGLVLTMFGALFKLESWEGANEMLIVGMVACIVPGCLLLSKIRFAPENRKLKTPVLVIVAGIALVFFGALSKLESWGYASELLVLGNLLQLVGAAVLIFKVVQGRK